MTLSEIEDAIAANEISAARVYTLMMQHLDQLNGDSDE